MEMSTELFGIDFEGLWRFEEPTQAALMLDPDAAVDDVAGELEDRDGVTAVTQLDEAEVDDRGELELLRPADEPAPVVLEVEAEGQGAAAELGEFEERAEVEHAFAPTCEALAGAARHHGTEQVRDWLDDAGCEHIAIIDAEAQDDPSWVTATGVEDDQLCIGTATVQAGMGTCTENEADPGMPIGSGAGGFVHGFVPLEADRVELDDGDETVTVDAVSVDDAEAAAYAAYLPDPDDDPEMAGARDTDEIDWRVLDSDGEVIDEG